MVSTIASQLLDAESAKRFRMVLAEYDIVATGIKTLRRRAASCPGEVTRRLLMQLERLEQKHGFDREAMWRFQVGDQELSEFLSDLTRRHGEDPLASLSLCLNQIKSILSPLSYALEILPERNHDLADDITVDDSTAAKRHNLELMAYELAFGRTRLKSAPLRHLLDVTSRCNLRCITCHQSVTQDVVHYDLADASLTTLTTAFKYAQLIFVAGMGEPLLSRSVFALVSAAKASGAIVEAITNGTALARGSRGEKLLPAIDMLMVSIDGGTRETYDAIRRNGSFDRLISNLRNLTPEARRKIIFNIVVCKQNVFTMGECVDLGIELGVGHICFQEMYGYLPWHGAMALDETERAWVFDRLPEWTERARAGDVCLICNLVRNTSSPPTDNIDIDGAIRENLALVSDVPVALVPPRQSLDDLSLALDELLAGEAPAVFAAITASLRGRLDIGSPDVPAAVPGTGDEEIDWVALRDHVEAGHAQFPHCMSTYAHLIVNGDGTTRPCCKVQNRLASLAQETFGDIWNAPPYVELRSAHAQQIAPREECRDCRDPVRFHFVVETLKELAAHDIDISRIRKPKDFPVPASIGDHPLVRELGSNALDEK